MHGKDKFQLLHKVALKSDADSQPHGQYLSVYDEIDINAIIQDERWSVEHLVARSHVNGRDGGDAENDPVGWIEATRTANSRRSNYPLILWPDPEGAKLMPNTLEDVDGKLHYVVPIGQRARAARKWLFIRATYTGITPPTKAQYVHAAEILQLAKEYPIQHAEQLVNEHYRRVLRWANPLLEKDRLLWLSNTDWQSLVFVQKDHS